MLQLLQLLQAQAVTCAAVDVHQGRVWTGHMDGAVLLHTSGQWAAAAAPATHHTAAPVRSLAIDARHCCWAGDSAGVLRVLGRDAATGQVSLRSHLVPPGAPGAGSPLTALLTAPAPWPLVFAAGGREASRLAAWHAHTYSEVDAASCDAFGPPTSLALLPWQEDGQPLTADGAAGGTVEGLPITQGAGAGAAAAAAGLPRATVPTTVAMANSAVNDAAHSGGSCSSWRLLSGHDRGQVIVWQLLAAPHIAVSSSLPTQRRLLRPVAVVGEPSPVPRCVSVGCCSGLEQDSCRC